jgi:hypothetical protein
MLGTPRNNRCPCRRPWFCHHRLIPAVVRHHAGCVQRELIQMLIHPSRCLTIERTRGPGKTAGPEYTNTTRNDHDRASTPGDGQSRTPHRP